MLRKAIPRPTVTGSSAPYTFHPDMLDETKTTPRLMGNVQEGVGALTPSDFGVNITVEIHGMALPSTLRVRREETKSNVIVEKITPLKILLIELEAGYELLKPIPVAIRKVDGSFIASFTAANVNSSGDTWDEAVMNLQSLLLDMLDSLLSERPAALGLEPKRQLSVLSSFIKPTEDAD